MREKQCTAPIQVPRIQPGLRRAVPGAPGYMERYTKSLAKEAVSGYAGVAKKHGLTPAQLALAWCKGRWKVTSTIIGATKLDQLKVPDQAHCTPLPYVLSSS